MNRRFVDNPIKVAMLFAALALMGALSYNRLALNMLPEIRTPRISVVVNTRGLTPEEAERRLTSDFERRLLSIEGVSGVTSYTRERSLLIHADFHWGEDMEFAFLDVKKNVGSLETNENIERIEVFRFDPNAAPLLTLAFAGEVDRIQMTNLVENSLRPKIETIEGVAYVNANGTSYEEVAVFVDEDVMAQFNLTPDGIIERIRGANVSQTGGVVLEGNQEVTLKFVSRFRDIDEIARTVVTVVNDYPVRLRDLGEIVLLRSPDEAIVRQDGRPTIGLDVYKTPEANSVQTAREVRRVVRELNARGDYGLKIAVDRSVEIESAIEEVVRTAAVGMGLAALVLLVFLRNLAATVVVALSIPVSIVATFSLMHAQGLSLNVMTLGGLALGAGMLVDNAIVVVENIFRRRQEGAPPREAAVSGVSQVAAAITASTLTTIVVFVPLVYVHGIAGILFKDQAMTVVYSLLVSLLVALVLVPMLAARIGGRRAAPIGAFGRAYGAFLSGSLRLRWAMPLLFAAIAIGTWKLAERVPSELFPPSVNGRLTMLLELPPGTPLDRTERAAASLERLLLRPEVRYHGDPDLAPLLETLQDWRVHGDAERFIGRARIDLAILDRTHPRPETVAALREALQTDGAETEEELNALVERLDRTLGRLIVVESVTSVVGVDPNALQSTDDKIDGPHTARIDVALNPDLLREFSAADAIDVLRAEAALYEDLSISFEAKDEFIQQLLGKNRGDLALEVHAEDLIPLREAARAVADRLRAIPGLINVRTNLVLGDDEFIIEPEPDALTRGEFTATDISTQVQSYLRGSISDKVKLEQGELAVSINNERSRAEGIGGLLNLQIVSSTGARERLRDLAGVRAESGLLEIMRVNQERTLLVMADLEGIEYQRAVEAVPGALAGIDWPRATTWNFSGEEVERRESFERLRFALVIAIVLVYMVIASILESLLHPLTIMLSVPFAATGVIVAFLLTGVSLNLMGYIGVVMLVGIVVNNAIVLLDRARQLRQEGADARAAVIEASRQRLRPILMTTLTTILALTPLALGFGNGAELRRPMAVAVIGGMISSTMLTLWLLPGFYLCVEDLARPLRAAFGGRATPRPDAEEAAL